jgi:exodeoxyribonuclease-5
MWLATNEPFFTLKGYAGTGKSYLMQLLPSLSHNFVFSAPTNKTTAVLSSFLGLQAKTIYSVLGMRMDTDEDKLKLTVASDLPDLGNKPILVIDECGMIPKFMADLLKQACLERGWRVIFVGDPAQLNPVGEDRSIVWSMAKTEWRALLKQVVRFDNELLNLSMRIRKRIRDENYSHNIIRDDNSNGQGVFVVQRSEMLKTLKGLTLKDWEQHKVLCWRNRTVDSYNRIIREALGFTNVFEVGENILMASPLFGESGTLAHTDEELKVAEISNRVFTYNEGAIDSYVLSVEDRPYNLYIPKNPDALSAILAKRADAASASAKNRKELWKSFWDVKNTFQNVKYGYAFTNHRAQGSTYQHVFADQQDILANPDRLEALRSLYVTATRPQRSLTTY